MSIADSLYNKIGFYDITENIVKPVVTPQNAIVAVHLALLSLGFHDPQIRLLIITFIYYILYFSFIYTIYIIFSIFKVSAEITILCIGVLLLSAYFLKIMLLPVNDAIYCLSMALLFYAIITLDYTTKINAGKLLIVVGLSIIAVNSRLNGSLILLSACLSSLLVKNIRRALLFLLLFCICYCSVFLIAYLVNLDFQGIARTKSHLFYKYSFYFFADKIINTLTCTIPGLWGGWSGKRLYSLAPFSISIIVFYFLYFRQSVREKDFAKIFTILTIAIDLFFFQAFSWYDSRYVIFILPLTLLAMATYFRNDIILKRCLSIILLVTIASSIFRLAVWDRIIFGNYETKRAIKEKIAEPYLLMSQSPRDAYYIFQKRCDREAGNSRGIKTILLFGNKEYLSIKIDSIQQRYAIKAVEYFDKPIVYGHGDDYLFFIVRIVLN